MHHKLESLKKCGLCVLSGKRPCVVDLGAKRTHFATIGADTQANVKEDLDGMQCLVVLLASPSMFCIC